MPPVRNKDKRRRAENHGFYTQGRVKFRLRKGDLIPANADEVLYEDKEPATRVEQVMSSQFTEREPNPSAEAEAAFQRAKENKGALPAATPPADGQLAPAELAVQFEEPAEDEGDVLVESPAPAQEAGAEFALIDPDVDHVNIADVDEVDEYRAENESQEQAEVVSDLAVQAPVETAEEAPADETASDNGADEQAADTEKPAPKSRSRKAK